MKSRLAWLGLAAAIMFALAHSQSGDAQPQGKKGPGKKGPFGRTITADEIVERIMSFDKDNDGKITKDELPERMQHLIALGDVNKDGALDRDEIRKLATTLESFAGLTGAGNPGGPPFGGPPPGAPKGGGQKGANKGNAEVARTLDDLGVTGKARENADRLLRANQDKVRRFEDLARAELVLQMKDVLSEEDYRVFKSALDRAPGGPGFGGKKGPPDKKGPDINRRLDQIQADLDELRKKLAK